MSITAEAVQTPAAQRLSDQVLAFVEQTRKDAQLAFGALRETGSLTAFGTVGFVERVPGEDLVVIVNDPGPFRKGEPPSS